MSGWGLEQVQTFCSGALPGVQVTAAKRLSGGFWNDVLRLETSRGRLILKRYGAVMPGTLSG